MKIDRFYKLSIGFYLVFSLILIVFSLSFVRIIPKGELNSYDPTVFNLIFYIPFGLWIAVFALEALMMFLCLSNLKRLSRRSVYGFTFVTLLAILTVFYALPHIVEPNPRFVDSWIHGRTAKGIIETGNLQPEKFGYQTYPSSFIFLSVFSIVAGMDVTSLLCILPVILVALSFFFLTLFVDKLFRNPKLAAISVLAYGLSTFGLAFHFSPEIFGWLFFILLLACIATRIRESDSSNFYSRGNFVVIILLLIGITTTHPVTQLSIVLIMLVLFGFGVKIWKTKFVAGKLLGLVMSIIILFSAWASFFGISYLSDTLYGFISAFRAVTSDIMVSIAARPLQENFPPEITRLLLYRQVLYLTILLTALFGGYFLWKHRKRKFNFLLGLLIASLAATPLTFFGMLPLERSIKLAFIPLTIFSAYLILERKKFGALILLFLLLTLPVNFASFYWNELQREMTFDWEISSARFISSNFHGILLGGFKETAIQNFYGNFSRIYNDYYLLGRRPNLFNYSFIEEEGIELVYITQLTILKESWSGRDLNIDLFLNSPSFDCVHSNEYSFVLVKNRNGS